MSKDEVVISGIGAHFPMSENINAFEDHILANRSLVQKTDRWISDGQLEIEPVAGHIGFEHFDDVFYGISKKLAKNMDPTSKLGYLRSFEALVDAGVHPAALRGSNTAVYAGSGINEFEQKILLSDVSTQLGGYVIMGVNRAMSANRISYYFDFRGPSVAVDSSFAVAHLELKAAADSIRSGECDAALVLSCSLARFPQTSWLLKNLGVVTGEGVTRSFDQNGTGAVRSDSAVAFFLQRADQAKRCYATVLASALEMVGPRSDLAPNLPSPRGMQTFLGDFYRSHSIDPKTIAYLEADGCGHRIRDECELNAVDAALVQGSGRSGPLLVGSVKSNIGHTDSVSGFAGICKAIVAMETGTIPATINFQTPNTRAVGLQEGRLKVADRNTPLGEGVVAVNTLGLFSHVGHTVLRANPRPRAARQDPAQHLPRLITIPGRTEDCVRKVASELLSMPFDTNYYRLVQDAFSDDIRGYDYRSYVICPPEGGDGELPVVRMEKRTVWFVYSGMGSQWAGMGTGLMGLPVFAETIERLHAVLEPKGVDLKHILSETGPNAFDNILKSFVGIAACQIALTNVLNAVGIVPDGIIGHSAGELGCAYGDGCLTEEQTILAAWARGHASNKATVIKGMMAAIGLGNKDILPRLPPTIEVACHNSDTSCTLSGPAEDVKRFVKQLSDEGVFAREVNVSDIAYHSRYIQPAGPLLREHLKDIIPVPQRRSAKWITTSVPPALQDTDLGKYCSVEYQVNNMLSPVLFEEGLQSVPKQSLLIEVAPHGLLQAILKRALPDPLHVPLTQRGHKDPVRFLLAAIGKTAEACTAPRVSALYPDVEFPVPRGTPSVGRLVAWQHDDSTNNDTFKDLEDWIPTPARNDDSSFVRVNDARVCPLSDILMSMWMSVAKHLLRAVDTCPVTFTNVRIERWPTEDADEQEVYVQYMHATARVEVTRLRPSGFEAIAHGRVQPVDEDTVAPPPLPVLDMDAQNVTVLDKEDVYGYMATCGLAYASKYRNIASIRMGDRDWLITVARDGSWANLLESMTQVFLFKTLHEAHQVQLPQFFQRLDVDPTKLAEHGDVVLRLHVSTGVLQGGGLYVWGMTTAALPTELRADAQPSKLQFVPFGDTKFQDVDEFLRLAVHTVQQPGRGRTKLTLVRLPGSGKTEQFGEDLVRAIRKATGVQPCVETLNGKGWQHYVASLLVSGPDTLSESARVLASGKGGALLACSDDRLVLDDGLVVLAEQKLPVRAGDQWLTLVRRAAAVSEDDTVVLQLSGHQPPPLAVANKGKSAVLLVFTGVKQTEVEDAVELTDARPYASQARFVFILDSAAPPFSLREPLYAKQLSRGERVNVLVAGGAWGSWKTLLLPKPRGAALSASSLDDIRIEYLGVNPSDVSKDCLSGHVDYVGVRGGGRVMGIGRWVGDGLPPKPDPLLRWAVPKNWTPEEAATVPYVYALVYHSMQTRAKACAGDSILVHEAASAVGQAAIRVATQLGCRPILATVRTSEQRSLLQAVFPQLEPAHILVCDNNVAFEYYVKKLTRGRGVDLIVNTLSAGDLLTATVRCLRMSGRILHFRREDMLDARVVGMFTFTRSTAFLGVAGTDMFLCGQREREEIADAVRRGLQEGAVQPIIGSKVFRSTAVIADCEEYAKVIIEVDNKSPRGKDLQRCDTNATYIVIGSHTEEVLLLADRLSLLGAGSILAVTPDSALVRQKRHSLRQQGTQLLVQQVRAWDDGAAAGVVKDAASLGALQAVVVVANENLAVASHMSRATASMQDVVLVLLTARATTACSLAALAEQREAQGCRTACLAAHVREAADFLPGLISRPSPGRAADPVLVLPSAHERTQDAEAQFDACLLGALPELSALGRAASLCDSADHDGVLEGVRLVELPSRGPRLGSAVRETMPLFALPPLGVLHPAVRDQLSALAAKLFCPVYVVETTPKGADGLVRTAKAIVQTMVRRQPHGPYNVLGWHLSTVLALEVERQLEAADKRGVVFLFDGEVGLVRRWAAACPPQKRVGEAASAAATATLEDDPCARRGRQALVDLLGAVASHQPGVRSAFSGMVRVVRRSIDEELSLDPSDPHIYVKTIPEATLVCTELAQFINEQSAHSNFAGDDDLLLSIDTARPYRARGHSDNFVATSVGCN